MDITRSNILNGLDIIKHTVIGADNNNNKYYVLCNIEEHINYVLNNYVKIIKGMNIIKDKNNLDLLPTEIIENILKYIDIKELFKMMLINNRFNAIIYEYIKRNITYCFIFKINKEEIKKNIFMKIYCSKCEKKRNNRTNELIGGLMGFKQCTQCKYKECIYDKKYIKNIEIKIIVGSKGKKNLINKNKYKFIGIIKNIYENSTINNTMFYLSTCMYDDINEQKIFSDFLLDIINIMFSETRYDLKIFTSNEIIKEFYINNNNLKYLTIPNNLNKLRLNLKNLSKIKIYDIGKEKLNEEFIKYVEKFSSDLIICIM